jgi:hypothetical protein
MRRPILTGGGRLSLGYGYAQPHLAEGYGSAAGPLWAFKAFLVLALPEGHPFWRAEEAPPPSLPAVVAQPAPRFVLCRDEAHDHVVALSGNATAYPNFRHAEAKYSKFAYSTAFGFSVPAGAGRLDHGAFDSMLALTDDGRQWRVRERPERVEIVDAVLYSLWRPWAGVEVETWLTPAVPGHLRIHRVRSDRALRSFEGGFAAGRIDREDGYHEVSAGRAMAITSAGASAVFDLETPGAGTGIVVETEPSTNVLAPIALLPGVERALAKGESWLCSAVVGIPDAGRKEIDAFASFAGARESEAWKHFTAVAQAWAR